MGVAAERGGRRKRRLAKRKPRPKYVFPRLEPLAECKKSERDNTLQRYWFSATCHASLLARTGLPHQEATVRYSEGSSRCRRGAGEGAVARSVQTINKPITHGRVCRQGLGPLLKRTVKRTVAGTKFRLRPICVRVKMRSSGHLVHVWCTVCLCTYAAGVKRGRGTVKQSTRRADAPPETRVILAPRPRCALVLDRHVQKSAGTTMRSIFLENALAGA